jgi:hypothetical protein
LIREPPSNHQPTPTTHISSPSTPAHLIATSFNQIFNFISFHNNTFGQDNPSTRNDIVNAFNGKTIPVSIYTLIGMMALAKTKEPWYLSPSNVGGLSQLLTMKGDAAGDVHAA